MPSHFFLLLRAEIESNPGPAYFCPVCSSNSVLCTGCGNWLHLHCSNINIRRNNPTWTGPCCNQITRPPPIPTIPPRTPFPHRDNSEQARAPPATLNTGSPLHHHPDKPQPLLEAHSTFCNISGSIMACMASKKNYSITRRNMTFILLQSRKVHNKDKDERHTKL